MAFIVTSPSHTKSLIEAVRRAMGPRKSASKPETPAISRFSLVDLQRQVSIPVLDSTAASEAQDARHKMAYKMARQDRWDDLGALIRQNDQFRTRTPDGTPVASILAAGARKDLGDAIARALLPSSEEGLQAATDGIEMLDQVLIDHADDYGVALVVAHAHMDLGAVWRGQGWADEVPAADWKKFARHFRRAQSILETFDPVDLNSPALAEARCRALAGQPDAAQQVVGLYRQLIDLAPQYAQSYRQFGPVLLPSAYGTYEQLEEQASQALEDGAEHWGTAGYALVYMDAALHDPEALGFVDVAAFLQGLHDYVNIQNDQATANTVAAYLSVGLAPKGPLVQGSKRAYQHRKTLMDAAPDFMRRHIRELHPNSWAAADDTHDSDAPPAKAWRQTQSGLNEAFGVLGRAYEREILRGNRLSFSEDGVDIRPS
jgi:hypothetical protein